MRRSLLTAVFAMCLASQSWALDGWVEASDDATTNWSQGYVEASAQGTSRYMGNRVQEELMAKQAARTTAQARLLEIIKGIRLTGLTTIGTHGAGDTRAATRIKGTLRGARAIDEKITWHKDSSSRRGEVVMAEVTMRVCISPACQDTKQNLTNASLDLKPTAPQTTPKAPASTSRYSAVIIDLEQAMYLPALAPQVINEKQEMVYSQDSVDPAAVMEKGLIHYSKSVEKAKTLEITGENPLVVSALRISKDNQIVLSNKDAQMMRPLEAVKQGRLIVALD
ncbi:exported hypothetical protein [Candidatus Terasakiella magnetica]|uniref:Uncharacterized protein n=1 Tax=Candidatus Terasakiella magnetica TaxID=1867952 RepID=A0A1C3RHR6_9PROT|nr:hypothetical protein [Candidatus Terasakiella magnetica]SCA56819.1 exported hypothetical protein [Candidatus Terasakiella magnetica]